MIRLGLIIAGLLGAVVFMFVQGPQFTAVSYDTELPATVSALSETEEITPIEEVYIDTREVVNHVPLPEQVKTIYMTSCVAGTPTFRQRLVNLIQETEINSVIIDVKDYSGTISFPAQSEAWGPAWQNARCGTRDMKALIQMLHDNNVYVIARITVFQDPFYAKMRPDLAVKKADGVTNWKDNKGLSFIDVAATEYWDHMIDLSADSYNIGFDELNFDYVRYPSDGPMKDISFPHSVAGEYGHDKQANLEAFFKYLNEQLDDESRFALYRHENTGRASSSPYTSAVQERTVPYFDFTAPMVYPSHYPGNYLGLGNPNDHPYQVVNHAMQSGVDRLQASTTRMQSFTHERIGTSTPPIYKKPIYGPEKLRTWIQDFDYGGDYDAADVRAQIQASYDAGVMSWMIWAPSNIYTKAALKEPGFLEVATSTPVSE